MNLTATLIRTSMLAAVTLCGAGLTACAGTPESKQQTAGELLDDATITTKIKAAFVEDKTVGATRINVDTQNGVVQLSGFANTQEEVNRAGDIAKNVKGVKSVKNDIRLK